MLLRSKSKVMGRISRPSSPCVLPSVTPARLVAGQPSAYRPTISKTTATIQHGDGGTYGDEFCSN